MLHPTLLFGKIVKSLITTERLTSIIFNTNLRRAVHHIYEFFQYINKRFLMRFIRQNLVTTCHIYYHCMFVAKLMTTIDVRFTLIRIPCRIKLIVL